MRFILVALIIVAAFVVSGIIKPANSHAQQIVMVPGAGGQMYPAYIDPQYGIDGCVLVPQPEPQTIYIYESVAPPGQSQQVLSPRSHWARTMA